MSTGNYKKYIKGIFNSVFVYSLIDTFFTILYVFVIGGITLLYTYVIGENSLIQEKQILVSIQIFLGIYFAVISITSLSAYIKFKRNFKTSNQE
ncbi:MAG: hypothetical protein ACI8O8_003070 [Oleiphilaceae bacterium]|jgi:hypothetical protein